MEINRNKQVKKKEFTELDHSIFHTSLWTDKQMAVIYFIPSFMHRKGLKPVHHPITKQRIIVKNN